MRILPVLALVAWGASGCSEDTPTGVSEGLLPVAPITVEVRIPWEQFASGLDVAGGFGRTSDRGTGLLARDFRGLLTARTLGRWDYLGQSELVPDSTGTLVQDRNLRYVGGRLVVFFDALASTPTTPVTISAHRMLSEFDVRTASWTRAVDSIGAVRAWPEPGAGPATQVSQGVWERSQGDSLVLAVDSASVRAWTDSLAVNRGFRIDVETPDTRLEVRAVQLTYDVVPSVKRDTLLTRTVIPTAQTYIYTPEPGPPASGIRVGGTPGWRSFIHMELPRVLTGPPELCAVLGCPFELRPERVNHAALVLETRPSDPAAFQPTDTVRVDVRSVLAPERLPRSPLASQLAGPRGRVLSAVLFATPQQVSIPITAFVRAQVAGDPADELSQSRTIALLSFLEPASIAFASFAGPNQPGAPFLRLILTSSNSLELP